MSACTASVCTWPLALARQLHRGGWNVAQRPGSGATRQGTTWSWARSRQCAVGGLPGVKLWSERSRRGAGRAAPGTRVRRGSHVTAPRGPWRKANHWRSGMTSANGGRIEEEHTTCRKRKWEGWDRQGRVHAPFFLYGRRRRFQPLGTVQKCKTNNTTQYYQIP